MIHLVAGWFDLWLIKLLNLFLIAYMGKTNERNTKTTEKLGRHCSTRIRKEDDIFVTPNLN